MTNRPNQPLGASPRFGSRLRERPALQIDEYKISRQGAKAQRIYFFVLCALAPLREIILLITTRKLGLQPRLPE